MLKLDIELFISTLNLCVSISCNTR